MTPRIVLFGPMGIGKTTAIRTLCGDTAVDCDVPNLDVEAHDKETTTVGAEFGVVFLSNHEELHVYGSPGQDRFGFLRQWLLSLAVGTLVLVDINQPDGLPYATELVAQFQRLAPGAAIVVLSARPAPSATLRSFSRQLADHAGMAIPVLAVDVREPEQMFNALELLVAVLPD
jgi:signal recognition particle receptor subunit beta